ncbi:MAG: F0F1 ATP synthase subunit B [Leptospiraceae bacterium]|nr:F0F1 ATP synthase subunit B [Leptospiraceae bacterium]MCB1319275.1 F0F1 ATP synthase subunit B [Leptospiraceae bacterium]
MLLEYLGEGDFALLDVDPGLVIWTFIIFGIVLFLLWKFAWGPITAALDERAGKIHADIDRAEKLRSDAEAKLADYENRLNGLREEGQHIIQEARKDGEELKNEILEKARQEAEELKNRAVREVNMARDDALHQIHQQVTELSIAVAARILEKDISPEDHARLIEESIKDLRGA